MIVITSLKRSNGSGFFYKYKKPRPSLCEGRGTCASRYHLALSESHNTDLCEYGLSSILRRGHGRTRRSLYPVDSQPRGSEAIFRNVFCIRSQRTRTLWGISHSLLFSSKPFPVLRINIKIPYYQKIKMSSPNISDSCGKYTSGAGVLFYRSVIGGYCLLGQVSI